MFFEESGASGIFGALDYTAVRDEPDMKNAANFPVQS
jgi:hypothetical protein